MVMVYRLKQQQQKIINASENDINVKNNNVKILMSDSNQLISKSL